MSFSWDAVKDRFGDLIAFSIALFVVSIAVWILSALLGVFAGVIGLKGAASGISLVLNVALTGIVTLGMYAYTFDALTLGDTSVIGSITEQASKVFRYLAMVALLTLPFAAIGIVLAQWMPDIRSVPLDELRQWVQDQARLPVLVSLVISPIVLYVSLGLMFAGRELAFDDSKGPISAITGSWKLASGHRWFLLGVIAVIGAANFVGALLCGLGLIASIPFSWMLLSAAYLALRE